MIKKYLPPELMSTAFLELYVKFNDPDSYLRVLFYKFPYSEKYVLRFPNEGWILMDLSCYNETSIQHWIRFRV